MKSEKFPWNVWWAWILVCVCVFAQDACEYLSSFLYATALPTKDKKFHARISVSLLSVQTLVKQVVGQHFRPFSHAASLSHTFRQVVPTTLCSGQVPRGDDTSKKHERHCHRQKRSRLSSWRSFSAVTCPAPEVRTSHSFNDHWVFITLQNGQSSQANSLWDISPVQRLENFFCC